MSKIHLQPHSWGIFQADPNREDGKRMEIIIEILWGLMEQETL